MSATIISTKRKTKEVRWSDLLFFYSLRTLAGFIILIFVSIFAFLYINSKPAFEKSGFHFFIDSVWSPASESYGALAFIFGTVMSSFLAILFALPVSIGSALFLTEVGPKWIRKPVRFLIELLAAIPSVVYGLWGIFVLAPIIKNYIQPVLRDATPWVPFFQGPPFGIGLFTAGLVLAIMIVPTITTMCVEVFSSIPTLYREGAKALGATNWETIQIAVLGPGATGIFASVILGLGRAMGETMAVTMVIGNRADISSSLFSPAATMASVIANEYVEASSEFHVHNLTAIGLSLLLVSLIVNGLARLIIWYVRKKNR